MLVVLGAMVILSDLSPTGKLFGVKPPHSARRSPVGATEGYGVDDSRQLVNSAPLFRILVARRHLKGFLLAAMTPAVES